MAQGDFESFSAPEESGQSPFDKKQKLEEEKPTVDVQKLVEKTEGNDDEDCDYYADEDDDEEDGLDDSDEEEDEKGSESDRVEDEEDEEGEGEEREEEEEELSSDAAAEMLKKQIGDYKRGYMPSDGEKVDHKTWIRYWRQIQSSEGFDIDDYPGDCFMAGIVPIRDFRSGHLYPELVELATMAIQGYNDSKGTKYQFKEILSVNSQVVSGSIYYITFEATIDAHEVKNDDADEVKSDDAEDAVEIFQAKVYAGIVETEVKICRPKSFANRAI